MSRSRHVRRAAGLLSLLGLLAGMAAAQDEPADLNTATQAELEQVRGVGPQLSTLILAERARRPFRDWDDVVARLPGIGPARARRLAAAGLRVAPQAPASASAPASAP